VRADSPAAERIKPGAAGPTYGLLATSFAVGFFGLAAEVILLYTFQSACGYAYAEVGLIVAVFMVGLALGAWAGVRWQRRSAALAWLVVATALYCVVLPLPLGELSTRAGLSSLLRLAFQGLVFAAGFLDGAAFPLLVAAMGRLGFERPGPWVYAADLAGSGLGALVTGALLVPVLGMSSALMLVALTVLAAWAAGRIGRRS
jgi:predicted membrane-bound spermidine synthase